MVAGRHRGRAQVGRTGPIGGAGDVRRLVGDEVGHPAGAVGQDRVDQRHRGRPGLGGVVHQVVDRAPSLGGHVRRHGGAGERHVAVEVEDRPAETGPGVSPGAADGGVARQCAVGDNHDPLVVEHRSSHAGAAATLGLSVGVEAPPAAEPADAVGGATAPAEATVAAPADVRAPASTATEPAAATAAARLPSPAATADTATPAATGVAEDDRPTGLATLAEPATVPAVGTIRQVVGDRPTTAASVPAGAAQLVPSAAAGSRLRPPSVAGRAGHGVAPLVLESEAAAATAGGPGILGGKDLETARTARRTTERPRPEAAPDIARGVGPDPAAALGSGDAGATALGGVGREGDPVEGEEALVEHRPAESGASATSAAIAPLGQAAAKGEVAQRQLARTRAGVVRSRRPGRVGADVQQPEHGRPIGRRPLDRRPVALDGDRRSNGRQGVRPVPVEPGRVGGTRLIRGGEGVHAACCQRDRVGPGRRVGRVDRVDQGRRPQRPVGRTPNRQRVGTCRGDSRQNRRPDKRHRCRQDTNHPLRRPRHRPSSDPPTRESYWAAGTGSRRARHAVPDRR